MALSAIIIVVIALASLLFGVILTCMGFCIHRWKRDLQFECFCPGDNYAQMCSQRRALYYAQQSVWRHEAFSRTGKQSRKWLLREIKAINVKATSEEQVNSKTSSPCCADRWDFEAWEMYERFDAKFRERLAAGDDELEASRKANEDMDKEIY